MIARPMVFFAVMFVGGMLFYGIPAHLVILLAVLMEVILYQLRFISIHTKRFTKEDRHRYLWPVFLLIGYVVMCNANQKCMDISLEIKKTNATAIGTLVNISTKENRLILTLDSTKLQIKNSDKSKLIHKIIIYSDNCPKLQIGNTIRATGTVIPLAKATNPGQYDEASYYQARDIHAKMYADTIIQMNYSTRPIQNGLHKLKQLCITGLCTHLPDKEANVLAAILFGEKQGLQEETKLLYQQNGMAHLMAISGLHVSLLGYGVYRMLRKATLPIRASSACVIILLLGYGSMTGFAVATLRAVFMFVFRMIADCIGRTYDAMSALSFSCIIILILQPLMVTQSAFILSFLAILAIELANSYQLKGIALCSLVQLFLLPVISFFFFESAPYAVFLNLLFLPFCSLFVSSGLGICLLSAVFNPLARFIAGTSYIIANGYEVVMKIVRRFPFSIVLTGRPSITQIVIFYLIFFGICIIFHRVKKRSVFLLFLLLPICLSSIKSGDVTVTCLDVGQGDCIVIELKSQCVIIDGGSSDVADVYKYRIKPYLLSKRIQSVDAIFVTHPDEDHLNGILDMIEEMKRTSNRLSQFDGSIHVKNLILPAYHETGGFDELIALAAQKKVPVTYVKAGDILQFDPLLFRVLSPFRAGNFNGNNLSLVLWMNYKNFDSLFTGDLEAEGELTLINQYRETFMQAELELLKMPHHGSMISVNQDFLCILTPLISFISAGKDNRYGHPHNQTLEALEKVNSRYYVTGWDGAISIQSDGDKWRLIKCFD